MAPEQTFVINHPYHPQDVGIPHYRPNKTPLIGLLGSFVLIIFILLYGSLNVAKLCNSRLGRRDLSTFLWFVLCQSRQAIPFIYIVRIWLTRSQVDSCTVSSKVERPWASNQVFRLTDTATSMRVLRNQPSKHCDVPEPLLTALEGVRTVGLPILDI